MWHFLPVHQAVVSQIIIRCLSFIDILGTIYAKNQSFEVIWYPRSAFMFIPSS